LACMGAGFGGRFKDTGELHAMNYNVAIKSADKPKWDQELEEEHKWMTKMCVW